MNERTKLILQGVAALVLILVLVVVYLNAPRIESYLFTVLNKGQGTGQTQSGVTTNVNTTLTLNLNSSYRFPPFKVNYDVYTGQSGYSSLPSYFAISTGYVKVTVLATGNGSLITSSLNGTTYPLIAFKGSKVYVGDYGNWDVGQFGKGAIEIKGDYGALVYPLTNGTANVTLVEWFDPSSSTFYLTAYVNGVFLGELVSHYPPGLFHVSAQYVSGSSSLFGQSLDYFKGNVEGIFVYSGKGVEIAYVPSGLVESQGVWASLNGTEYSLVSLPPQQ